MIIILLLIIVCCLLFGADKTKSGISTIIEIILVILFIAAIGGSCAG